MRTALALLAIALCGCASTTIYDGNGHRLLKTQADLTNITFTTASGLSFHADQVNHSTPTLAGGQATFEIVNAASGMLAVIGSGVVAGIVAPNAPIAAAIAPSMTAVGTQVINGIQNRQMNPKQ